MNLKKKGRSNRKVLGAISWMRLAAVSLLIISGCTYYKFRPTVKLNLDQSDEEPAVFEIYCGSDGILYSLKDETGRELFYKNKYLDLSTESKHGTESPTNGYPLKIELKPGSYALKFRGYFHETPIVNEMVSNLEIMSGHYYRFGTYHVMYKQGWVWIEDLTTSEVVAGTPPPRDVRKEWRNYHGFCRSAVLDYL